MFARTFLLDALERTLRGFLVSFLAVMTASATLDLGISLAKTAAVAGLHGGGVVLLALLTKGVGGTNSASVIMDADPPK